MINETLIGLLLLLPAIALLIPSLRFVKESRKTRASEKNRTNSAQSGKVADYKQPYWTMLGIGFFSMWIVWIGAIVLMIFFDYAELTARWSFSSSNLLLIQIIGLVVFYIGGVTYCLHVFFAGKYIQPSNAGTLADHKLVDRGTFAVVRHPLYVCYVLISAGLSITLTSFWYLIPTALVLIGIYPTARAEEEALIEQLGNDYIEYRKRVGMFFPKIIKSR